MIVGNSFTLNLSLNQPESSSSLDKKTKINFQNFKKRISKDITVIEVNHEYNLNENHNMNLIKL